MEPSRQLRELEQAILRQDPALELLRPVFARRPRAIGALALVLAAAVVAAVVAVIQGGTEPAPALAEAGFDGPAPYERRGRAPDPGAADRVRALGAGSIWTVSSEGELVRIHPGSGAVIATIGFGVEPSGVVFGEGSAWT